MGVAARATLGISTLAERHRVEEIAEAVRKSKKGVVIYIADLYVGKNGYVKLSTNALTAYDVAGPGSAHETAAEKAIRKSWSKPKRRV